MADVIGIEVDGIDKVRANLDLLVDDIRKDLGGAGKEAAAEVLDTVGLRAYPRSTAANEPPTPYYIRGRGMQRGGKRVPEYNDNKSQKLGTQWYTRTDYSHIGVTIGNKVTYAPFVHGEEQAGHMASKGWRKLVDVANEKIDQITAIYQGWIDRFIRMHGL